MSRSASKRRRSWMRRFRRAERGMGYKIVRTEAWQDKVTGVWSRGSTYIIRNDGREVRLVNKNPNTGEPKYKVILRPELVKENFA